MVALAFLPVLAAPIPGFADMPSHMARHHILALFGRGGPIDHFFDVNWRWIANLGADLPAVLLARWMGAEAATRLVASLIAPLMVAGMLALSRAVHGRISASAYIALPLAFNQAYLWGFLNFCLSAALALLVAAWLIGRPSRSIAVQLVTAACALVIWTAHMVGWGILLIIAAGSELAQLRSLRDIVPAVLRNLPLLAPVIPLLAWRAASTGPQVQFAYGDFLENKAIVFQSIFKGIARPFDLAFLLAIVLAGSLAWFWAGRRRFDPRLLCAGLLLGAVTLAAPITILNAWGTDLRIAPVALLLLILSISPAERPDRESKLVLLGSALFLLRLDAVTRDWVRHSAVLEKRLELIDQLPRGSRLGYIYIKPRCGHVWHLDPDAKLASYAVVRRDAFTNTLFQVLNADLMVIRDPHMRITWAESSQYLELICPAGRLDPAALSRRMQSMREDGFDAIWISGMAPAAIPLSPGFRLGKTREMDALIERVD